MVHGAGGDDVTVRAQRTEPGDVAGDDSGYVELRGVAKTYRRGGRETHALEAIDLSIRAGEFLAIVGPSGCGKSTLLRIVAGLHLASAGETRVAGRIVDRPQTELGIVFQSPVLLDWRTALDNVLVQVELRGLDPRAYRDRAMRLLEQVGLADFADRYPHELSGGMRQRVAIARALIHDAPLLLMDEPFGALDALTRSSLQDELVRILETTRSTVVMVTHDIDEAILLSDRIVMMSRGPAAKIAGCESIELKRPRDRLALASSVEYATYRKRLLEFLYSRQAQAEVQAQAEAQTSEPAPAGRAEVLAG